MNMNNLIDLNSMVDVLHRFIAPSYLSGSEHKTCEVLKTSQVFTTPTNHPLMSSLWN